MIPGAALAGMQVLGGITKGIGQWSEMKTQNWAYSQRAKMADFQAVEVERATKMQAADLEIESRRLRARQVVQMAKSGFMPGSQTDKLVMAESKARADRDIGLVLDEGAKQASQLRLQAIGERYMAASNKAQTILGIISGGMQTGASVYKTGSSYGWWK